MAKSIVHHNDDTYNALYLILPTLRAYGLGLLSTTFPGLLNLLLGVIKGKIAIQDAATKIISRIKREIAIDRWPTACAILVASASVGPLPFLKLLSVYISETKTQISTSTRRKAEILIRFSTIFCLAAASFQLLNRRESKEEKILEQKKRTRGLSIQDLHVDKAEYFEHAKENVERGAPVPSIVLAGRTLDLTFFASVRAADVAVCSIWSALKSRSRRHRRWASFESLIEHIAPPAVFSLSSAIVMWAWFFEPERLPRSYKTWISNAAQVDGRLIEALRQIRRGTFKYGQDTGMGNLLGDMAEELGFPRVWGDPAKTVPIPCELYHSGTGPSCEWHAFTRFFRAWRFAMYMYLPLNLLVMGRRNAQKFSAFKALLEASQSSAFLGAFVSLFYYGVCFARTRFGPKIFSYEQITPGMWDGGLAVGNGCVLCGWSILLEKAARRQEVAYFVAPRALATIFPRRYEKRFLKREQFAFAFSIAILLTAVKTNPHSVRGVFGRLLQRILR